MKSLKTYIFETTNSFLDNDTLAELNELNTLSPTELKNVFKVLNYKPDSKEAKEILDNLPDKIIEILKKYKYAVSPGKYYTGIRSMFSRVKLENHVARKLNSSVDISNVKQVSHDIDRKENYDLTSSIGTIDVKCHFFGNKNFVFNKHENNGVEWFCFVDMDLSDVTNFNNKWRTSKLYLVNVKKMFDISQTTSAQKSRTINYDDRVKLTALLKDCPVDIKAVDEIPNSVKVALWSKEDNVLYVKRGGETPTIFKQLAKELTRSALEETGNTELDNFKCESTSYMLCKKYGIDVSDININSIPEAFQNMSASEVRNELTSMRSNMEDINTRMSAYFETITKAQKNKEHER